MSYKLLFISRTTILLSMILLVELTMPPLLVLLLSNTILYLAIILAGYPSGVIIGMISPWIAFQLEHFPAEFTPVVPYLIFGNIALVCVYYYFYRQKSLGYRVLGWAIILAALTKFLIIHVPIQTFFALNKLYGSQLIQLYTALIGGMLAVLASRGLHYVGVKDFHALNLKGAPL